MSKMEGAFKLLKKKATELNQNGLNFELTKAFLKDDHLLITVIGKISVDFAVCNEGDIFHLNKDGKGLQFLEEGLVNYMLIEANGGPELGRLTPEGWPQEHCKHLETISPT